MSRAIDNVTLTYTRNPADSDSLRLTVRGCGDTPWDIEEGLNGVTAESLRDSAKEEFDNARLNCKIADGVEERVMAGFDEAFAQVKPILPPHTAMVGGWKVEDKGGLPGDDSERTLTITKAMPTVTMTYQEYDGDRAAISLSCKGSSYGGGFDFGNPPAAHLLVVNEMVDGEYNDFAKDCETKAEAKAVLMQDFAEALATLDGWIKAKPFVYPPDTSSN